MLNSKELPNGYATPPRPIKARTPVRYFRELGLALGNLLKASQALAGALTMPLHCGVGTQSPTCTLAELDARHLGWLDSNTSLIPTFCNLPSYWIK